MKYFIEACIVIVLPFFEIIVVENIMVYLSVTPTFLLILSKQSQLKTKLYSSSLGVSRCLKF